MKTWYSSKFFLSDFETFWIENYITKYLKLFSTCYNAKCLISLDQNVSIIIANNIYIGKY